MGRSPFTSQKNITSNRKTLVEHFLAAGIKLSASEAGNFWTLHKLLEERNPADDLTRVSGFYNLLYKHYIDGAMAAELIKPEGLTMDLGTGAGFPGLPMAIRRPQWPLLLAEPRGRRLAFMEEVAELLELKNIEFYPHKVGPRFDRKIDNFITRDFESVASSIVRAAMIIPPGGRVYLMKGPKVDAEIREAAELEEYALFDLEADNAYELGESGIKRRLLTFCKKFDAAEPKLKNYGFRVLEIASRQNARYKSWQKVLSGRGLKKSGEAIISGRKFVAEIFSSSPQHVRGLIVRRLSDLDGLDLPEGLMVHLVRPELFTELDIYGTGGALMLLQTPQIQQWDGRLKKNMTVFLPFQDPSNLGAAIRSCTALGADVVLLKEAANPWHPKSLRAAGPSLLHAALYQGPTLQNLLDMKNANIFPLAPAGENLLDFKFPEKTGFIFGIEGPGLRSHYIEAKTLSIPMQPGVESLNAAAALAVSLGIWMAKRRH